MSPSTTPNRTKEHPNSKNNPASSQQSPPRFSSTSTSTSRWPTPSPSPAAPAKDCMKPTEGEEEGEVEKDGEGEAEKDKDKERDGDDEELSEKGISTIHPDKVAFFETLLPAFFALSSRSREKTKFWEGFPAQFFAKFPLDKYPAPEDTLKPLPAISEAKWKTMTRREKDNHKKKEKRRTFTPEQRAVEQAKWWFLHQQNKGSRHDSKMNVFFKNYRPGRAPPRKLAIEQFLTSHPEHKNEIASMSAETSKRDRLSCRSKAAKQYIQDLPEEDVKRLVGERDEQYEAKRAHWAVPDGSMNLDSEEQAGYQQNLPRLLQPILDACSHFTGMSIFLQAGLELDHPDEACEFDVLSLSAVPEGCPTLDRFGLAEYDTFNLHFLGWLQEIECIKLGLSQPTDSVLVPPKSSLPANLDGLFPMDDEDLEAEGELERDPQRKPGAKAAGKSKGKKKKGSKSRKKKSATNKDKETSESEFQVELDDESGEESKVEADERRDEEEQDELAEEEDEAEERPRGPPMSAYEVQREKNIEEIRQIWANLEGPQAVAQLRDSLAQPSRPQPKPKRKSRDPIDIAPSNVVTRSQRNHPGASAADSATSSSSSAQPPAPEKAVPDRQPSPSPTGGDLLSPSLPSVDPPSPAVPKPSEPMVQNDTEANNLPQVPPLMGDEESNSDTPRLPQLMEDEPVEQHQPSPSPTAVPPFATLPAPSAPSPHGTSEPSPGPTHSIFLDAFRNVTVDFDPAIDRIHPSAYKGKKTELVSKLGEWLFKVPAGCSYGPRPVLYDAVVCKWMELESLWIELEVEEEVTANTSRPEVFSKWFRDGREKRPGRVEATPSELKLDVIRTAWWR
ncbi:hypothetical protein V5O48_010630 [Marasmius crinis-equi]|uniref:Uncharacterized protein n=1 Tax=Marasmius crinis-equi TaxID=585013 RepID=A0ABR3F7V9_9AGAR